MTTRPRLALPLAALLAACASSKPPSPAPPGAPLARLAPVTPGRAEAEARATDLAFSAAAVAHDARAFASFLAADAVFVNRGGVAVGVAAIGTDWTPLLQPGGPTLAWTPDTALAADGGDLVLTRGAWTLTPTDGGPPHAGRYLTVWRREADGRFRVALDASDTPLPAESSTAVRRPLRQVISADQRLGAVAGLLLEDSREVGGFLRVEVRDEDGWRVLAEVGSFGRPGGP